MLRRSNSMNKLAGGNVSGRSSRRRSGGVSLPERPAKQLVEALENENLSLNDRAETFLALSAYVVRRSYLPKDTF